MAVGEVVAAPNDEGHAEHAEQDERHHGGAPGAGGEPPEVPRDGAPAVIGGQWAAPSSCGR